MHFFQAAPFLMVFLSSFQMSGAKRTTPLPPKLRTINVVTVTSQPFAMQAPNGTIYGLVTDLLDAVSPVININYTIALEPNGTYGIENQGTWNGMIGRLIKREFDLAAGDITVTASREKVVEFTLPFFPSQMRILYNPKYTGKVRYLVMRNTAEEDLLRSSPNSKALSIWSNILINKGFVSSEAEGIRSVSKGGYAYVCSTASVLPILPANTSLRFMPDILQSSWIAFAVPQGSKLRHDMSVAIAAVAASGRMQEILEKYQLRIVD